MVVPQNILMYNFPKYRHFILRGPFIAPIFKCFKSKHESKTVSEAKLLEPALGVDALLVFIAYCN